MFLLNKQASFIYQQSKSGVELLLLTHKRSKCLIFSQVDLVIILRGLLPKQVEYLLLIQTGGAISV